QRISAGPVGNEFEGQKRPRPHGHAGAAAAGQRPVCRKVSTRQGNDYSSADPLQTTETIKSAQPNNRDLTYAKNNCAISGRSHGGPPGPPLPVGSRGRHERRRRG